MTDAPPSLICKICETPILAGQPWILLGAVMVGNGIDAQRSLRIHFNENGHVADAAAGAMAGPVIHAKKCLETWVWDVAQDLTWHYRTDRGQADGNTGEGGGCSDG